MFPDIVEVAGRARDRFAEECDGIMEQIESMIQGTSGNATTVVAQALYLVCNNIFKRAFEEEERRKKCMSTRLKKDKHLSVSSKDLHYETSKLFVQINLFC